jgi:G3E family GTPase
MSARDTTSEAMAVQTAVFRRMSPAHRITNRSLGDEARPKWLEITRDDPPGRLTAIANRHAPEQLAIARAHEGHTGDLQIVDVKGEYADARAILFIDLEVERAVERLGRVEGAFDLDRGALDAAELVLGYSFVQPEPFQ